MANGKAQLPNSNYLQSDVGRSGNQPELSDGNLQRFKNNARLKLKPKPKAPKHFPLPLPLEFNANRKEVKKTVAFVLF